MKRILTWELVREASPHTGVGAWNKPSHESWCVEQALTRELVRGTNPHTGVGAWNKPSHGSWCVERALTRELDGQLSIAMYITVCLPIKRNMNRRAPKIE